MPVHERIEPSAFEPLDNAAQQPPQPANTRRWWLIACALLFALVMLFLLSARSLQVVVTAETPASIALSGLALPFGDRYLLRPGQYTVRASAEGYHPLQTEVTVDERDSQTVELTLQLLPGLVSIDSVPAGASVQIDGEPAGQTPLKDLPLEAGEHSLLIEAERYLPLSTELTVTGRNIPQQLELALAPAWAEVTIDSLPPGAAILVDGESAGTTPAVVEIIGGERQLILQLPGYADWQQPLTIEPGQALQLGTVQLQPAAGVLELASVPSGANVTLDGEFHGQTPLSLELTPDKAHRLAVFKPGYRRHTGTVQLPAAGRDSQTIKLVAQLGEVRFNLSPAGAELKVDGVSRGKGSQTLSLPAFEHSVEVSLAGYNTVRRRVTPRPGLQQLVEVTLLTAQEARQSRIKPEITTSLGQTLLLFSPADSPLSDFTMGASRREPGRRANEVMHPVSLRRAFYLQTTEVTNAQFRQFASGHNSGQIDSNSLNRDHQPAVQVSWQQAAAFCNWLSKREGLPLFYRETNGIITGYNPSATGYRLPSEAEWAWAARASGGSWLKFPWGDAFPPPANSLENYADNSSAYVTGRVLGGYMDGHVVSAPVGSFKANQNRLFDMGGNVAEWAHDAYSIPSANGATEVDPLGAQSGDNYVIRGASWSHSKIAELRLSYRDYGQAGRDDVGFRLARYAE
ncbi:MAG: PEGA domain-containing protein [Halieaceae bacterium]|jgi:formylglycine-generating enzyme required for sulfatase activity|nr:PEGA domain-containing protein [Halieaceae bacterium]